MRPFDEASFLGLTRAVGSWASGVEEGVPVSDDDRDYNIGALQNYLHVLTDLGLSASRASLERLVAMFSLEGCTWSHIQPHANELAGRLVDETNDKLFFSMSLRETDLYRNPFQGWEVAIERFPHIVDDVEEATKCLTLSRFPASVFHSTQVVEAVLIELGRFLDVNDPRSGWTAVSNALTKVTSKSHSDRTSFEKKHYAFLEQVQGTVHGLKNAWRNKISHVQGRLVLMSKEFSPEVAEEILIATRSFVRRLAEDMPQQKQRRRSSGISDQSGQEGGSTAAAHQE